MMIDLLIFSELLSDMSLAFEKKTGERYKMHLHWLRQPYMIQSNCKSNGHGKTP